MFHQQLVEKQQVIDEQAAKIASLADKLETGAHVRTQVVGNTQGKGDQNLSYAQAAAQDQLRQLQSKVDTLTSKQVCLEKEKEREKRNKNVLFGNVREGESPNETREKVGEVIRDLLKADCKPIEARRVGKQVQGKSRLIWVKLKSEEDKLQLLRQAKALKGTGLFLAEDLSPEERKHRRSLVAEMKKARDEGKRAFIRYSDGKLIVNGKVGAMHLEWKEQ